MGFIRLYHLICCFTRNADLELTQTNEPKNEQPKVRTSERQREIERVREREREVHTS